MIPKHASAPVEQLVVTVLPDPHEKNAALMADLAKSGFSALECQCGAIKVHEWGFDPMSDCVLCGRPDQRRKLN